MPIVYSSAGLSGEYIFPLVLADGERFRVMMAAGFTGTIDATIYATLIKV